MSKEMIKSAFFEKELAGETLAIATVMVEALDCEPILIENEGVKRDYEKVTDLLRKYTQGGWKRSSELALKEKALVEYFPLVLLERIVLTASDNLKDGRDGRSSRMYRFVAEKLGLGEDPRTIVNMFGEKIDEVLVLFEDKYNLDVFEITARARAINGALFPASQE